MGVARQRVAGYLYLVGLAPGRVAAAGGGYFGIPGRCRVGRTQRKVHLAAVGSDGTGSLVVRGVQAALHGLWLGPLALVILYRYEYIAVLGTRNAAQLVARSLVARRGEIQPVVVGACQHRAVVCPARVEHVHALNLVPRARLLYRRRFLSRQQPVLSQHVARHGVEYDAKLVGGLLVSCRLEQLLGIGQPIGRRGLSIAYGVGVGSRGPLRLVNPGIAGGHLLGSYAPLLLVLGRRFLVRLAVLGGSVIVFAEGEITVAPLQVTVGATAATQQGSHGYHYNS